MDKTRQDIVAIQDEKSYNIDTAVDMLIFADLEDGQASIERDRQRLDI